MKNKISTIILSICTALMVALAIFIGLNRQLAQDFFTSLTYRPDQEMVNIEKNLNLTVKGALIFHASMPQLESESDFNKNCKSYNPGVSVIGCYVDKKIHIYNIQNKDLSGITESTSAHELMHAIWLRLPNSKKKELEPILLQIYDENKDLLEIINNYEEASKIEELFARIGTEIKNTNSDELEQIFAEYFNKRTKLVDYYNAYSLTFNKLANNIKGLSNRLDELKASIEVKTEDYLTRTAILTDKISQFNQCAEVLNCFSESDFVSKRAELSAEKNALDNLYNEISLETTEYNQKVSEYNQNALKIDYYTSIVNSNESINGIDKNNH